MKSSRGKNVDDISVPDGPNMSFDEEDDRQSAVFVLEQLLTLMRITFQTSSKIVTPALTQMMQTLLPTFQKVLQYLTPVKLHQYLELLTNSAYSIFKVVSQTPKGKDATSQLDSILSQIVSFSTSGNVRQVIVEGMGMLVKGIDSLQTPEMKGFLTSIPIFLIRVADAAASGEAKILYHSVFDLWWQVIELLGQDETTVALAEGTAKFVHILEMEREIDGPMNRRRKQRRVKIAGIHTRDSVRAMNAKRRYQRNRYIQDTYSNRDILEDASLPGVGIEDAILSSLGEGTRSDNAWLTSLGNLENFDADVASLPSRVILPNSKDQDNLSVESIHSASKKEDSVDMNHEEQINVVDMTFLRESIKQRKESYRKDSGGVVNSNCDNLNITTHSIEDDSYISLNDECTGIEDLVSSELVYNESRETVIRSNFHGSEAVKKDRKRLIQEDGSIDDMHLESSQNHSVKHSREFDYAKETRGKLSSVSHFFRTLDDLNMIHNQEISKMKLESNMDDAILTSKKKMNPKIGGKKQSESSTLPKRFSKTESFNNDPGDRSLSLFWSSIAKQLFTFIRQKKYFALTAVLFSLSLLIWFVLGCIGVYFIFQRIIITGFNKPIQTGTNEIIIRIIREAGANSNEDAIIQSAIGAIENLVNPGL